MNQPLRSRRDFLSRHLKAGLGTLLLSHTAHFFADAAGPRDLPANLTQDKEPIIDIHQHANYDGRTEDQLVAHQRAMGIIATILHPAGHPIEYGSTYFGVANGLQAQVTTNEAAYAIAQKYPNEFFFASNEVPDVPGAIPEIEKYLKLGAKVIGELKFGVECDSPDMQNIYKLAHKYDVPVLMHWQYNMYNRGFERFHKMLKKYPGVVFIGHAQTWWANIDKNQKNQNDWYPMTKVTPGGITDRLLSDYPNVYGDYSFRSGYNSLFRDKEHGTQFLNRHQDKLMFGSDCPDIAGSDEECLGTKTIALIRELSPNKSVERKVLYENAKKVFRF